MNDLPVVVIGAGPVGLAAAARLVERDLKSVIFEKGNGMRVEATLGVRAVSENVDPIIVATGFRHDFSFLREVRLGLDPSVKATPALAPADADACCAADATAKERGDTGSGCGTTGVSAGELRSHDLEAINARS